MGLWLKDINDKPWYKYIVVWFVVSIWIFGNVMFWISFHNIDLMSNYALIFNDLNSEYNCNDDFINLREITDCNGLMQCPDYQTIYINSVNLKVFSYILLNMVILIMVMGKVREVIFKKGENARTK